MAKIIQGELPKVINVVVNTKIIAVARFNDEGVYETSDKEVIKELKRYGYEVIEEKPIEPKKEEEVTVKKVEKPKPKAKKKKEVK